MGRCKSLLFRACRVFPKRGVFFGGVFIICFSLFFFQKVCWFILVVLLRQVAVSCELNARVLDDDCRYFYTDCCVFFTLEDYRQRRARLDVGRCILC